MWNFIRRRLNEQSSFDDARWVVVDVESSGLDVRRDRLLAIAALALHRGAGKPRLRMGDSFEVLLRQPDPAGPPDTANILLHGIGIGAQLAGVEPGPALESFAIWLGHSPLVAFHADFDRAMLDRAFSNAGRPRLPELWLDLAPLATVLHPGVRARSLDDWLAHFSIRCAVRHQAAADSLATAELLQHLWPALVKQLKRPGFRATQALAAASRWLPS